MAKTMTKMFTDIFDEPLKARGYHRKGKIYCKLEGEFIYGVTIKAINPYIICFSAVPYWLIDRSQSVKFMFHKGYWIESETVFISCPLRYDKEREELNSDYMSVCLNLAETYALPHIEAIKSIEDYTKVQGLRETSIKNLYTTEFVKSYSFFSQELKDKYPQFYHDIYYSFTFGYRRNYLILQYALLDIARKDGNFDRAYSIWQRYDPENRLGGDIFGEKMKENDLDWILRYKEEQRKFILPHLRDELKINTAIL